MRFDYTDGKPARYVVSVYWGNVDDHRYFHYHKDAKRDFDKLAERPHENGVTINLYDMVKDVRKEFKKF